MQLRVFKKDLMADILHDPACESALDESDEKEVSAWKQEQEEAEQETTTYTEEFKNLTARVHKQREKDSKGKGRGRGGKDSASAARRTRLPTKPPKLMDDNLGANEVQTLLPDNFLVGRDAFNARWLLTHKHAGYLASYSWQKWGYVDSAKLILKEAWKLNQKWGFGAAPWPLDDAVSTPSSGSGAAASSTGA